MNIISYIENLSTDSIESIIFVIFLVIILLIPSLKSIIKTIFWIKYSNFSWNFNLSFVWKYSCGDYKYNSFDIPKRDWTKRNIEAPNDELKNIQKEILKEFNKIYLFPSYVTAFKKKSSIKNNASKHINKKMIINIDIENFFNSITNEKITNALKSYKWIKIEEIYKLLELTTYKWRLPQGAPTSPFLANLTFIWIDKIIINLLKKYDRNVSYTRYADDITFSSNNTKIKNAIRIITDSILPKYWYKAKKKKTTIYRSHTKQIVTWLVVNEKVSYPRNKYMKLRSMICNYLWKWIWDVNVIKWHLAFLKNVDKKKYLKLRFYYLKKFTKTANYEKLFKKWKKRYNRSEFINPRNWEKIKKII